MKYIFGNLKMYLSVQDSLKLAGEINELRFGDLRVALFPNALAFSQTKYFFGNHPSVALGVQNIDAVPKGAYTGALSPELSLESGAKYAIVGHSERRYIFGETDADVRKKIDACISVGVIPVVCIGETREDKEANTRTLRLQEQLKAIFENLDLQKGDLLIAYEPVWAISHGASADLCLPADVEDVHGFIRQEIARYTDKNIPLLYGGSVNSENIVSYISIPSVDGVLVGNSATKKEFWQFVSTL